MFQETVRDDQPLGVVGDLAYDGPIRAKPFTLNSADENNNVIGRFFTQESDGVAIAGGDAGTFGGILINSKSLPVDSLFNNEDGLLAVRNGTVVELLAMGEVVIQVPGAAAIGDPLKYADATGVIGTGAPAANETAIANAAISNKTPTGAGVAIATLTN